MRAPKKSRIARSRPGHTLKYAAAFAPRLVHIETKAGRRAGKPKNKTIQQLADVYAFQDELGFEVNLKLRVVGHPAHASSF